MTCSTLTASTISSGVTFGSIGTYFALPPSSINAPAGNTTIFQALFGYGLYLMSGNFASNSYNTNNVYATYLVTMTSSNAQNNILNSQYMTITGATNGQVTVAITSSGVVGPFTFTAIRLS